MSDPQTTTRDGVLNRRVWLEQPEKGFRVAVDTVLLASSVPAVRGQRVLDMGCGVGGVMLCLAARVEGLLITGLEIQPFLAELCQKNIEANDVVGTLGVEVGDVAALPENRLFDHVVMNPPFHDEGRHDTSPNPIKKQANTESEGDLSVWIEKASHVLVEGGVLTLIHRADRQEEIIRLLSLASFGALHIKPLLPAGHKEAKRVVMRAKKGGRSEIIHWGPLVLHQEGGAFTEEAEGILRHLCAMKFE